jgi:hypothetical protein
VEPPERQGRDEAVFVVAAALPSPDVEEQPDERLAGRLILGGLPGAGAQWALLVSNSETLAEARRAAVE